MSELKDLLEQVRRYVVIPLQHFRAQTSSLDAIHYEYVQRCFNSVMSLLEGEAPFRGAGADALAELIGNYIQS